jgi:Leucine-rich repeat (LRR) protein
MMGLASLASLRVLNLDHNDIPRLEGIATLRSLQELYLSNQRVRGEMEFEEESLQGVAGSLTILHMNNSRVARVSPLGYLTRLKTLYLTNNPLTEMDEIAGMLDGCAHLNTLHLKTCPITESHKYRDRVILMSKSLATLDDKEITDRERKFLQVFYQTTSMYSQQ